MIFLRAYIFLSIRQNLFSYAVFSTEKRNYLMKSASGVSLAHSVADHKWASLEMISVIKKVY